MLRLVLVVLLLLVGAAGCTGSSPTNVPATQSPEVSGNGLSADPLPALQQTTGDLPAPGELGKNASSFRKLLGSQVYKMRSAWVDGHTLFLQAPILPDEGGEPKDESPPKIPSATSNKFAYGLFLFGGINKGLATLEVDTGYNLDARFWVAIANWDRNSWDFSFGSHFAKPTLDISDQEQFDPYVDAEGRIAVAIIAADPTELIEIHSLELTLLSEVSELKSNNFRWDGVMLNWSAPNSTSGFRVLRRLADDLTGPWDLVSGPPLGKYEHKFTDTQAVPGVEYTYLVQSGFLRSPGGIPRWFWSPGVTVNGHRQVSEIEVDTGDTGRHVPFLVGNRLGFFSQRALDLNRVDGVRTRSYTPGTQWDDVDTPETGYTPFTLLNTPGFSLPLLTHQYEQVNNPVCSLIYSTVDGTYAQVCDRQTDDGLMWHPPVKVRDDGTVIVALVNMPRRIGAVVFNESNDMLELVDSVDINGRIWYEFDPGTYPWMAIGEYRPDGPVTVDEHEVDPKLCFRDAASGEMKFLEFSYSGWIDSSPDGVLCAPGPMMATASLPLGLPESRVFYISPDRSELRMLGRDIYGDWHPEDQEVLVATDPGSELLELALFTSGKTSFESYLVYNIDGNLYACRSVSTGFNGWTPPVVLDGSGSCRDLRIIKVGSNEDWESHHYASYIRDGMDDTKLISFRDLFQATAVY